MLVTLFRLLYSLWPFIKEVFSNSSATFQAKVATFTVTSCFYLLAYFVVVKPIEYDREAKQQEIITLKSERRRLEQEASEYKLIRDNLHVTMRDKQQLIDRQARNIESLTTAIEGSRHDNTVLKTENKELKKQLQELKHTLTTSSPAKPVKKRRTYPADIDQ